MQSLSTFLLFLLHSYHSTTAALEGFIHDISHKTSLNEVPLTGPQWLFTTQQIWKGLIGSPERWRGRTTTRRKGREGCVKDEGWRKNLSTLNNSKVTRKVSHTQWFTSDMIVLLKMQSCAGCWYLLWFMGQCLPLMMSDGTATQSAQRADAAQWYYNCIADEHYMFKSHCQHFS